MRPVSTIGAGLAAVIVGVAAACSDPGAGLGETCAGTDACAAALQCFDGVCSPRCDEHADCGDGYRCEADGACAVVRSQLGDPCEREIQCGPGQACTLLDTPPAPGATLGGVCREQANGLLTGSRCAEDLECQTGVCALGVCTELCAEPDDCPAGNACALVPRLLDASAPLFHGCLPATGVIVDQLPLVTPAATARIPVPSTARSFALITRLDDPDQLVGATRVVSPTGQILFVNPDTTDEFYANPIRYQPAFGVSTLFVPNSPGLELEVGVYRVDVSSLLPIGGTGTAVPEAQVVYKMSSGTTLDLNLVFLDLDDHPCAGAFDGGQLDAGSAQQSARFAAYLEEIGRIFEPGEITLGRITYRDVRDRGDLDGLARERLGDLLSISTEPDGINVFFVRSIAPVGVQALAGGTPGPPRLAGSPASGVAVSVDTLCYRDWDSLARVTAQALVRQMGLYSNRDPNGESDTIADSDTSAENLSFFGEFGGTELSEGQRDVLRRYPGVR